MRRMLSRSRWPRSPAPKAQRSQSAAAPTPRSAAGRRDGHAAERRADHPPRDRNRRRARAPTDRVTVHYHGTFPDGKVFDSSVDRGQPATFPLNRVIDCWTEGVQMIKVGGKAQLICPPQTAYGPNAASRRSSRPTRRSSSRWS